MIDRNLSLELVQDISSLHIKLPNMSNPDVLQVVPRIHVNVSIYSMRIDELKKNYYKSLFVINMQWLLWIYLSMYDEPCVFIRAYVSDWIELGLING